MASQRHPLPTRGVQFVDPRAMDPAWSVAWDDLSANASEPNCFMERWFITPSLAHLDLPASLRIAIVWGKDGRMDGLFPLHIADRYGRMPIDHVRNWLHYNIFLGVPLVRAGQEEAFWIALIEGLDAASWAEGFVHLTGLVKGDRIHSGLIKATAALDRTCAAVMHTERALLQSAHAPTQYYETTVRKKKRKEINRLRSRLCELGELSFTSLESAADIDNWCDDFLVLEQSGWKGELGSALGSAQPTESFFRDLIRDGYLVGRVEMLKLSLNTRPIAMLVNFIALPGSFSFKIAFDEEFARYSPGVLIQIENLKQLDRPGFEWMDSCAVEDHPMINSLWGERRPIVWVTFPLSGVRRRTLFSLARLTESSWAAIKRLRARPANDNRDQPND
jgi:hypothetical protein